MPDQPPPNLPPGNPRILDLETAPPYPQPAPRTDVQAPAGAGFTGWEGNANALIPSLQAQDGAIATFRVNQGLLGGFAADTNNGFPPRNPEGVLLQLQSSFNTLTWNEAFTPSKPTHPGLLTELSPGQGVTNDFLNYGNGILSYIINWGNALLAIMPQFIQGRDDGTAADREDGSADNLQR